MERDSALGRAIDRATGLRAIGGNAVDLLVDGAAFVRMHDLITGASRAVHFENYIIRDDGTGQRFATALMDAARRGVTVRVLYDQLGCRHTGRAFWQTLRSAGVEVRPFNPMSPFSPLRSLRRDHRKYVAVDGTHAVLGGMCIGDEWAGKSPTPVEPWRDTAVEIRGPAVSALELTFADKWREAGGAVDAPEHQVDRGPDGDATVNVVDGIPGKLRVYRALELLAASAAERIWIAEAYLIAPPPLFGNLLAAARDGVDVRLLLPGRSDIAAIRAFTRVGYRELLSRGVRIWEWQGSMLHAKTAIVDGTWFKVGSSNLNPSSFFGNHELDVLVNDPTVAVAAARQFRRDLGDASEVRLRPARMPGRLGRRLPQAVVAAGARPVTRRRRLQAVLTLRQVALGARRSILGAAVFLSLGLGAVFLVVPRLMAYALAGLSFWLAGTAAWHFFHRREHGGE